MILSACSLFVGVLDIRPSDLFTGSVETWEIFLISRLPRLLAILCTGIGMSVAGLLHIGLALHLSRSDAADHDVDMDVSRMVVPIRVSADDGGMTGEVFFAEFQAKSLCRFHGQAIVGCISGVKADDIMVGLHVRRLFVKQYSTNDTATGCQDWLLFTPLGLKSIKSHDHTAEVLAMGLFVSGSGTPLSRCNTLDFVPKSCAKGDYAPLKFPLS
jgi:hypothetical protein